MPILGIVTNEGLDAARSSNNFSGWDIDFFNVSVSNIHSAITQDRTINTLNTVWYSAKPSKIAKVDNNVIEIYFDIPEGYPSSGTKEVAEIYVTTLNNQGEQKLFAVGQVIDVQPITKGSGDYIQCSTVISLKPYEDVDAINIQYNYDIGLSTTNAIDVMDLLEAGDNIELSFERNQVRIDINSPWDVSIETEVGNSEWLTINTVLTQFDILEEKRVVVDSLLTSYGGGIGIRLVIATLDGSGNDESVITLDRRDYYDAISSEAIQFDNTLTGDEDSTRDVEFRLQIKKLDNVEYEMSNTDITVYEQDPGV